MRIFRSLAISALAFVVASSSAFAADDTEDKAFYRLSLHSKILSLDGDDEELPPGGGTNNPLGIIISGGTWRAPASIDIPAIVTGVDGTFTVTDNSPELEWAETGEPGEGRVTGVLVGSTRFEITAEDAGGSVTEAVDLVVNPALTVSVDPGQLGPYRPGDQVTIEPQVFGQLGALDWTFTAPTAGSPLLADDTTGVITGIAGAPGITRVCSQHRG